MKLLTPEEVAERFRLKPKTLYNWVADKKIPHLKIGGRLRFDEAALEAWAKRFFVDAQ